MEWKVKEGSEFSAGDVLLEVETDKAQIDVEAQDDGVLAKIIKNNGDKDIPVGEPIGIIAEVDEDYSGADFLALAKKLESKPETKEAKPEPKIEAKPEPKTEKKPVSSSSKANSGTFSAANPKQTLFPSVLMLLAEANISAEEALRKIPASGPSGRLLKGDVLLYLGKISEEGATKSINYFKKHEKLELPESGEVYKEPKPVSKEGPEAPKPEKKPPVVISKAFSVEGLELGKHVSLQNYVEEAVTKAQAYALQLHPVKSDYYDELFEEIIQVKGDRFSVDYTIGETVEFKVTLDDKFDDSKEKADLFVQQLSSYFE